MSSQTFAPTSVNLLSTVPGAIAWTDAYKVYANDNDPTSVSLTTGQSTYLLFMNGFGFTIPTGATITNVTLNLRMRRTGSALNLSAHISKTNDDSQLVGSTVDTAIPTSYTDFAITGFGGSLTPSEVNATNFSLYVFASLTSGSVLIEIDWATVTIDYTGGGGGGGGGSQTSPPILFLS